MTTVRPFRGLRPVTELAAKIASLPYDVMDTEEARSKIAADPYSFLTVTKSEAALAEGTDVYSDAVYEKARENLVNYVKSGKMKQDKTPCFYIYRQRMNQHIQIGLVAAASVEEYRNGTIKRHELTRTEKEQDRVRHITETKAQTGPVFLTYKQRPEISSYILKLMAEREPVINFIAEDGVRNTLYVVDSPLEIQEIVRLFKAVPAFYIADGHHRCAGAMRVADAYAQQKGEKDLSAEYEYFQAVMFPDNMTEILAYNRVVTDLAGAGEEGFLQAVEEKFTVRPVRKAYHPEARHTFGMYLDGRWYELKAKPGTFDPEDSIASLDVSVLQDNLLTPVLKIGDPRTDKRIGFVGGIRGLEELERKVDSGKFAVAFSMYPTLMQEVMTVADMGKIMPPKSTWFEPKLRDGMVVHLLEDLQ
jgi:uncharacterized protein (DUF1015 family)